MNYKEVITDPYHFIGRSNWIESILEKPNKVRIILGGRRIGKSSLLHAIQWNMLISNQAAFRAFPVLINLHAEEPKNMDNFRYILMSRLEDAIENFKYIERDSLRSTYQSFLKNLSNAQIGLKTLNFADIKLSIDNPHYKKCLDNNDFRVLFFKALSEVEKNNFNSICFILDGADYIAHQDSWANSAWSYLRGLKDYEPIIKNNLGIILSGYRELKEFQQRVGSKLLEIADIDWLESFNEKEISLLINNRCHDEGKTLSSEQFSQVKEWAGYHPYLSQQMLNTLFHSNTGTKSINNKELIQKLLIKHHYDFLKWWNSSDDSGGFGQLERDIYLLLLKSRQLSINNLSDLIDFGPLDIGESINILLGSGVISRAPERQYIITNKLFETWVNIHVLNR